MQISAKNFPKLVISCDISYNSELRFSKAVINSSNSLLFPNKSKTNFWSQENNWANKKRGKLVELIFFGLNYNAKRIRYFRKPFVLDLQKSHKIKVSETRVSAIKTRIFKRRSLFFSFDREKLATLTNYLKAKRPQNSYSGHGLLTRTDNYKTKAGKIRQK